MRRHKKVFFRRALHDASPVGSEGLARKVGRSSLGVNNMIARIKDFLSFLSGLKDKTSYPIETAVCLE